MSHGSHRSKLLPALFAGALLLPQLAAAQDQTTGTLVKNAPVRGGAAKRFHVLATLPKGERVTVISTQGEYVRLSVRAFALARVFNLAADKKSATVKDLAMVWASPARFQARLPKDAKVEIAGVYFDWMVQIPLYVPKSAVKQDASPGDALAGEWKVSGRHSKQEGNYTGTVTAHVDGAQVRLVAKLQHANGEKFSWTGTGKLADDKLTVDVKYRTPGAAGALDGDTGASGQGTYTIGEDVDGGWTSTSDASLKVTERWARTGDVTGDDPTDPVDPVDPPVDPPASAGKAKITAPKLALGVPGTPTESHQAVSVEVKDGPITLAVSGPGRLMSADGATEAVAANKSTTLQPGTHRFQLEAGSADGAVVLTASAGDTEVAKSSTQVTVERVYLFVFGYQGTETHYLPGDVKKVRRNLINRITSKGYVTLEDGESYDQTKISSKINDPKTPRKVVLDWSTSRGELFAYLNRGTVRGLLWGSHGYMEPFIGCPDEELDRLESRVWSCPPNDPTRTEKRNFVREWQAALTKSVSTHKKLDFIIMHSCCTGGLGTYYWDKPWDYTFAETKTRAKAKLGDPLPEAINLRFRPFDGDLGPQCKYLKTYDGPSYFGFSDVSYYQVRKSYDLDR